MRIQFSDFVLGPLGQCERCGEPAVGCNDDGVALCEDCLADDLADPSIEELTGEIKWTDSLR